MALAVSLLAAAANIAIVVLISRRLTSGDPFSAEFVAQFAGVVLFVVVLDFGVKWLLLRLTAGIGYELRSELSQRILHAPLAQLEQIGAPRLLAALTDDVNTLVLALSQIPGVVMGAAILVACLAYLVWLSPPTLLLAGLLTLPAVAGQVWVRNKAQRSRALTLKIRDQLFRQYRMLTEGVKELKMHRARRAGFLDRLLRPTASDYEAQAMQTRSLHYVATSWAQTVYLLFILALFVLAAAWELDASVMTSFALAALYARTSLNGLFSSLPFLSDAAVAVAQLDAIGMQLDKEAPVHENTTRPAYAPVRLRLRDLRHTYRGGSADASFHLGPLSLEMQSGELIFLIGGNGSGKTTLAKLVLGLYAPQGGQIEWNGQPVTQGNIDDYRQLFSVVFADFFLFDQLLGLESHVDDRQARYYLEKLQLSHKVQINNGGFSTTDLSTGQRQRLALLTAYLEDRPVYLFDEWAAGQDPQFKELFYRQLLPDLRNRGKLVIVISHDDHYYTVADRIVKLDFGQIDDALPSPLVVG